MRVRMSSFTCTLTGGSQFAICNLRNLREHFFSESRMKLASILPSVRNVYGAKLHEHFLSKLRRFPESVDTRGNVVLDLLTTFLHFCIFVFLKNRNGFQENLPLRVGCELFFCIFVGSNL